MTTSDIKNIVVNSLYHNDIVHDDNMEGGHLGQKYLWCWRTEDRGFMESHNGFWRIDTFEMLSPKSSEVDLRSSTVVSIAVATADHFRKWLFIFWTILFAVPTYCVQGFSVSQSCNVSRFSGVTTIPLSTSQFSRF